MHIFVLPAGERDAAMDSVRGALTVVEGPRRVVRRVWLDTFDWRLYRAGMVLEQVSGAGQGCVSARSRDGGDLHAEQSLRPRWPARLDALPAGPLRDLLAPVVEMRALLPVSAETGAVRECRILDAERKTVARLTVDDTPDVTWLYLAPVRGYAAETDAAVRVLAGTPGVTASARSRIDLVLEAAGITPAGYSGKVDVALSPRMPAVTAVGTVLLRLLDTAEANVDGVLRDLDTEFLHDLRISVRRTRSALKLAGDVLPDDLAARFRPEFTWLGELTTPTRDLDVFLMDFDAMAARLRTAGPADLEPLRVHLTARRIREYRRLARGLRSARFADLARDWRAALSALPGITGTPARRSGPTAARLAAERTARAYRRVLRLGSAITDTSPDEDLHDLRKRGKELRYVLEFFASVQPQPAHRGAVRQLKALQDCLGAFQDASVQQETIRSFAADLAGAGAPPGTLLAMGELVALVRAGQQRVRGEFAERFAKFAGPRNRQRMALLTAPTGNTV